MGETKEGITGEVVDGARVAREYAYSGSLVTPGTGYMLRVYGDVTPEEAQGEIYARLHNLKVSDHG